MKKRHRKSCASSSMARRHARATVPQHILPRAQTNQPRDLCNRRMKISEGRGRRRHHSGQRGNAFSGCGMAAHLQDLSKHKQPSHGIFGFKPSAVHSSRRDTSLRAVHENLRHLPRSNVPWKLEEMPDFPWTEFTQAWRMLVEQIYRGFAQYEEVSILPEEPARCSFVGNGFREPVPSSGVVQPCEVMPSVRNSVSDTATRQSPCPGIRVKMPCSPGNWRVLSGVLISWKH